MSLLKQQNLLARIFTDENLRRKFFETPEIVAQRYDLSEKDCAELREIISADLNSFADSLFYKRLNGVEKLLPLTKKILKKDFQKYFREFALNFQPESVKKHLEDAVEFTKFLAEKVSDNKSAKDSANYEQARLLFGSYHKSFIIRLFDYDLRRISAETPAKKKTLAIWLRFGKLVKHFII